VNSQPTLLLGRRDIEKSMSLRDYVDAVESAFAGLSEGRMNVPDVVHIPGEGGAFHVKSAACTDGARYVAVKVNGNFPDNPSSTGLPTIQGAIFLCDGRDGRLLAIIDSIEVTAMRTGAASAVAAKYLSRPDSQKMAVIGCGVQGLVQLQSVLEVRSPGTVYLYDLDRQRAVETAETARRDDPDREYIVADDIATASTNSDIILTCTTARSPVLRPDDVSPGSFIAAVGADNDDKQELSSELLANSTVVCDLIDQCKDIGDLHHAISDGAMTVADVAAELGDVVSGRTSVDWSAQNVVVFDSTGSAIQDVAAAGVIYERALASGSGTRMRFA